MSTLVQPVPLKLAKPTLPQADSCLVVIFGATGDLTRRKLVPALYDLACVGCTSRNFDVLGIGRSKLTDDDLRARLREGAADSNEARNFSNDGWNDFAKRLHYLIGDANQRDFYPRLKAKIEELQKNGASRNLLFYVSTQASLAPPIVEGLGSVGLARNTEGWTRIILEKPFGRDLKSAQELNEIVAHVFDESSVYRIDHYLGKETVQNILMFRFGNSMFEPVWNRNYIEYIEITAAETLGVEGRGAFYEETGALRDMVANHMLQLLMLTAMEPPVAFDADAVRGHKVDVLSAVAPMTKDEVAQRTVRGQYGPGQIDGKPVPGYRQEPGVKPNSVTETYAAVELRVDNWRWAGVPFYLRTGKRLPGRNTHVVIQFRRAPFILFRETQVEDLMPNQLVLHIQPEEGISLRFAAKKPGPAMQLGEVDMDFEYSDYFGQSSNTGYERLLHDCMIGDATLFQRADMVEAGWSIVNPVLDVWKALPPRNFPNYPSGTWGPKESDELLEREGRRWRNFEK